MLRARLKRKGKEMETYTYWTDGIGYIWRVREDGYANMWKPTRKEWSDTWVPRQIAEENDLRAGLKEWDVYTGAMPEGSLPEHRCTIPVILPFTQLHGTWSCSYCGAQWNWRRSNDDSSWINWDGPLSAAGVRA